MVGRHQVDCRWFVTQCRMNMLKQCTTIEVFDRLFRSCRQVFIVGILRQFECSVAVFPRLVLDS